MRWVHVGWQAAAVLVGLVAGYSGVRQSISRRREQPLRSSLFNRRRHQIIGWVFAGMLLVGYGLGLLRVHRAGGEVMTGPHALVGTMVLLFAAIVVLLGTALSSREDDRLAQRHRLFGGALFVLIAVQIVLGVVLYV